MRFMALKLPEDLPARQSAIGAKLQLL